MPAAAAGGVFSAETAEAADIAVGRLVEVEGFVGADGVLLAREFEFELAKSIKIEMAPVDAVDLNAQTVTLLGIQVSLDPSTRIEDDSSGAPGRFGLADVQAGDSLCIRAFIDPDTGKVVASKIEREDPRDDGRVILQGPLDAAASTAATFVILGVSIDTSTIDRFENLDGTRFASATAFLQAANDTAGARKLVKLRGSLLSDGGVRWERAELELEHRFHNEVENEFEFEVHRSES